MKTSECRLRHREWQLRSAEASHGKRAMVEIVFFFCLDVTCGIRCPTSCPASRDKTTFMIDCVCLFCVHVANASSFYICRNKQQIGTYEIKQICKFEGVWLAIQWPSKFKGFWTSPISWWIHAAFITAASDRIVERDLAVWKGSCLWRPHHPGPGRLLVANGQIRWDGVMRRDLRRPGVLGNFLAQEVWKNDSTVY